MSELTTEQNPCIFCQIQHNFRGSKYFFKLGKEYLNTLTCKIYALSRENSATFDISHAFLLLTIAKLSTPKNSPVFVPPCMCSGVTLVTLPKL